MSARSSIALGLFGGLLSACGSAAPPPSREAAARGAEVFVVGKGPLEDRFVLTGELESQNAENLLVPRTPIWLLSIRYLAEDGAVVKKGDKIVEFDSSSFAGTIEDKRSAVVRTESELLAEVAKGSATLAEKSMDVERKRAELERAAVEASVPSDLYARRVYQERQLALLQKRDALAKAEEDLATQKRTIELDRAVKEVARTRAARELAELTARLEELILRAPRDGMIQIGANRRENRKFLVGDQAIPGHIVASMPQLHGMQARARLSDVDDGAIREGMRVECILDAYPAQSYKGSIRKISPVARAEGREDTRRFFDVEATIDDPLPATLRPGMSVRIEVIRRRIDDAFLVPRGALPVRSGRTEVRLAEPAGGTRSVQLAGCNELSCAATGELAAGLQLLAAPGGKGTR